MKHLRGLTTEIEHHHRPANTTGEEITDYLGCLYAYVDMALAYGQIRPYSHREVSFGARGQSAAQRATSFTIVRLLDEDDRTIVSVGVSFCTGNYDRKLGTKIALGRATKFLATGGVNAEALEKRYA